MTDGDRIHGQGIQLTSTQNRDLERVGPPPRRKWPWEDFINKNFKYQVRLEAPNIRRVKTWQRNTPAIARRWTSPSTETTVYPDIELTTTSEARATFLSALTKSSTKLDPELQKACDWYCTYLEHKINKSWVSLLRPVLQLDTATASLESPNANEMDLSFRFLAVVLKKMSMQDMALTDPCDKAYDKNLLRDTHHTGEGHVEDLLRETDEDRSPGLQLVFAAVGWLNCVYIPKHYEKPLTTSELEHVCIAESVLASDNNISHIRAPQYRDRAETSTKQGLDDCRDQPLNSLLVKLGSTIPKAEAFTDSTSHSRTADGFWIEGGLVNYDILRKVAQIEIEWVEILGQHLEFDAQRKKLKLFKYPSICLVLLINSPANSGWLARNSVADPHIFYHEILISYRLLFDSPISSWARWTRMGLSQPDFINDDTTAVADPLLKTLCVSPNNSPLPATIYKLIRACEGSSSYDASKHFPFLGTRLLELQAHVRSRNVGSIRGLWYDQRVLSQWWTFWAVIWFGGAALFLGLLQVILQIIQVVMTGQQLDSGKLEV